MLLFSLTPLFSQSLPGGQYDNYEAVKEVKNAKKTAIISAGYKHTANSDYSMNDLGLEVGFFALQNLVVGGEYYYLFDRSVVFDIDDEGRKAALKFDYFGAKIDYFITDNNFLPVSVGLNAGLGKLSYSNVIGVPINNDLSGDWVSYLEPGANLYYYISPSIMMDISLAYRFVSGVEYKNLSNSDISGLVGGLGVSFVLH